MCSAWRLESFSIIALMVSIPPSARVSTVEKLRNTRSVSEQTEKGGRERARRENALGVASSSVPVTLEGLGVKRDGDTPLLSDADEEEPRREMKRMSGRIDGVERLGRNSPGHPEVVTHVLAGAGSDLELPLGRHDLGVDARDGDSGVEAGAVVSLDHVASVNLAGSCESEDASWLRRSR
jgi:hypothetical protein